MAKRDTSWTMAKYKRFLSENRGAGELTSYKPWLSIQDFPSNGRVSRIKGWKTNRIHHFFSDIQTRCFYMFEWDDEIVDIREHYPLLDLVEVVKDNKDLKQEFFTNKEPPYILTTTFLLTLRNRKYIARTIKSAGELEKKSVLERLEIERRYWAAKQIDFGIITQKEIPTKMVKNIEWIHSSLYTYEERGLTENSLENYCNILIDKFRDNKHSIRKITSDFDKENNVSDGTGLFIFKYLLASKHIYIETHEALVLKDIAEYVALTMKVDHYLVNSIKKGIAYHHKNLPDNVKRVIEVYFKRGIIKVLASTSTLAQGLNFPISTIIVGSLNVGGNVLTPADFENLVGRAGRAMRETEGYVVLALPIKSEYSQNYNERYIDRINSEYLSINTEDIVVKSTIQNLI